MNSKTIVITGSTKGIGHGLSLEFLKRNCRVVISGRNRERLKQAEKELAEAFGSDRVRAVPCDVTDPAQVQDLWDRSVEHFGRVDIWINNAGIAHPPGELSDLEIGRISSIIETNISGLLYGCRTAIKGMMNQGSGAVYNLEGLGSDGRIVNGMSVYGMTKRAVNYITRAMHRELAGTPVIAGAIYPGMVVTDLLTADLDTMDPEYRSRTEKIINILGDKVETVTPRLTDKILGNTKNGVTIKWLTGGKAMARFMTAGLRKRNVLDR